MSPDNPATGDCSMESELLTRPQAADYLGVKPDTLAVWSCTHRYALPYLKVGRAVRYRKADLDAWLDSRRVHHEGAVA